MTSVFSVLGRFLGTTIVRSTVAGAFLGFGWIFGELMATKIIDRIESTKDESEEKKEV